MSITGSTDLGNGLLALTVDHDPTAVATDAPAGSLIIDSAGVHYRKLDGGSTTNVARVVDLDDVPSRVLGEATIDLTITTKQTLYTVPSGLRAIVLSMEAREPNGTISATVNFSLGFNAAADNVVATDSANDLDVTQIYGLLFPDRPASIGQASETFGIILDNANGGTATTIEVRVVGRELV